MKGLIDIVLFMSLASTCLAEWWPFDPLGIHHQHAHEQTQNLRKKFSFRIGREDSSGVLSSFCTASFKEIPCVAGNNRRVFFDTACRFASAGNCIETGGFTSIEDCKATCQRFSDDDRTSRLIRKLKKLKRKEKKKQRRRQRQEDLLSTTAPDCELQRKVGNCDNFKLRYYFDTVRQECRKFFYSGCGGNLNNFRTEEDCEETCIDD